MAKKSIVVVGAGYAGVSATKYMAKKLKKDNYKQQIYTELKRNNIDRSSLLSHHDDRTARGCRGTCRADRNPI